MSRFEQRLSICLLAVLGYSLLAITPSSFAEPDAVKPAQKKPSDLDAKLLEGLGAGLLDDLPDLGPSQPNKQKTNPDGSSAPEGGPPQGRDIEGLPGEDIGEEGESLDPLTRIGQQMRRAEKRIAQQDASKGTQTLQQEIVANLEQLIKKAQEQKNSQSQSSSQKQAGSQRSKVKQSSQSANQQQGQGSGNTAKQPAKDSSDRLGADAAKEVDMAQMRDLIKDVWGSLPGRMREQMNQDAVEEFLPKYRLEIEEYFRRLAEEPAAGR